MRMSFDIAYLLGDRSLQDGTPTHRVPDANYCNGPTDNFTYTVNGGDTATVAMAVTCR